MVSRNAAAGRLESALLASDMVALLAAFEQEGSTDETLTVAMVGAL